MKQLSNYLRIGLLLSIPLMSGKVYADDDLQDTNSCKTIFKPMSQGENLYTQYHKVFDIEDDRDWYFDASATYRFMQTYKEEDIAQILLNTDSSGVLWFQDAWNTPVKDNSSLIASYFGMGENTDFKMQFKPRIQNQVIDLQLALGGEKLWMQVNVPITYSKWQINKGGMPTPTGTVSTSGYPAGETDINLKNDAESGSNANVYYTTDSSTSPVGSASDFMEDSNINVNIGGFNNVSDSALTSTSGIGLLGTVTYQGDQTGFTAATAANPTPKGFWIPEAEITTSDPSLQYIATISTAKIVEPSIAAVTVADALGGKVFGNLSTRSYAKFTFDSDNQSDWKVADLPIQLGYDFYKCDNKHFGFYLRAVIPTGTDIDVDYATYLFQPIIGNGGHFEFGVGASGHAELWSNDDNAFNAYVDGYLTHMFAKNQFRIFDATALPMSRYALMKEFTYVASPVDDADNYQYNHVLKMLGDINNATLDVYCDLRGEFMLDLVYTHCDWEVGAGYAFSGKTHEKYESDSVAASSNTKFYGYKGNSFEDEMYIQVGSDAVDYFNGASSNKWSNSIAVSSHFATLAASPLILANVETSTSPKAVIADTGVFGVQTNNTVVASKAGGAYLVGPLSDADGGDTDSGDLLQVPDINNSGLMGGLQLHKIFGHIDYVWSDCDWMPYIGVVGSIGMSPDSYKTASCWDVGARLGFSY
jgi:hypothetical protein